MHDRPDLYVILGVDPSATPKEIQTAYRQRITVVHPDRFDRERAPQAWAYANAMLRELNEAYRVVSDPRLRAEYDQLHFGLRNAPPWETNEASPSEAQSKSSLRPFLEWLAVAAVVALLIGPVILVTDVSVPSSRSRGSRPITDRREQHVTDALVHPGQEPAKPVPAGPAPSGGGEYSRARKELRDARAAQPGLPSGPLPKESAGAPIGCELGVAASPLPANGQVWSYYESAGVAPLEIRVRGANQYLVKLERNRQVIAMMLVRASSTAKMMMPLGDYVLKYAAGSGEYWCGEQARLPFGGQTSFHKADEVFSFTDHGDRYSGYTIELFLQRNGNLSTSALSPQDW